ncbi:hypothetical protein [Serratia marcescens]|uniref:hypothetical protein n=1 Tax=Serratia marcescens TaxID=615 RepID=UPI0039839EEE
MTQSLTTEQLRARAAAYRRDAETLAELGDTASYQRLNESANAFDELAANREAQPVQVTDGMALDFHRALTDGDIGKDDLEEIKVGLRAALCNVTAPPAPANANAVAWEMRYWNNGYNCWHDWERITAEQHAEMSAEHATSNDYEFRILYDAPLATNAADWGINMQTGTPILVYKNCSVIESEQAHYVLSLINSAAQPAPAVPDEISSAIRHLNDTLVACNRFNYCADAVKRVENACRAAMLAAAPEGGNG